MLFDGSRALRPMGTPVRDDYKSRKDFDQFEASCGLNDYSRQMLLLAFPDVNGATTVYTAEYNTFDLTDFVWGREVYSHNPTAFGFYTKQTALATWADTLIEAQQFPDGMPWEEEQGPWFSESEQVGFPSRVFGTDLGKVYIVDENVDKDAGTAFDSYYDTPDFSVPGTFLSHIARWLWLEFEATGTSVTITYSTDEGKTFNSIPDGAGVVSLTGDFVGYQIPLDVSSRTIRIRFTCSAGVFKLRWARMWTTEGAGR